MNDRLLLRRIRIALTLFIGGLVLSGLTAFPIRTELEWLLRRIDSSWLGQVQKALEVTDNAYPFLAYGTDWLAFAHLAIATAFIGPWLEPVRNKWVITFGLIACAGVIPLALIAGSIRGIPLSWRLVDCSFGVHGCCAVVDVPQVHRATGTCLTWSIGASTSVLQGLVRDTTNVLPLQLALSV